MCWTWTQERVTPWSCALHFLPLLLDSIWKLQGYLGP